MKTISRNSVTTIMSIKRSCRKKRRKRKRKLFSGPIDVLIGRSLEGPNGCQLMGNLVGHSVGYSVGQTVGHSAGHSAGHLADHLVGHLVAQ